MSRPVPSVWAVVCHMTAFMVLASMGSHHGGKDDPHGGVPMGIPNRFCDDGKNFTTIDWDPSNSDEYTCHGERVLNLLRSSSENCEVVAKRPIHVCYPEEIEYAEDLPTSGRHRPLWPKYGEYQYLPPQRWLHSLEHGAIVFLYNPCASKDQIRELKALARGCLRRHIISPSKRIPMPNMFAVLSWKCKLLMTHLDILKTVSFIKRHALHSPEKSVYSDGQYSIRLIQHAELVSDNQESKLCPQITMLLNSKQISMKSRQRQSHLHELRKVMERINIKKSRYLNSNA